MCLVLMMRALHGCGRLVLVFALTVASLVHVRAGEAIIIGKEKPRTDAIKETKFNKELSRPWENAAPETPLNGLLFPILPRIDPGDPRMERKRKIQERERRNWMSVRPGELQDEEERKNFLGVREYELEKEDDSDNLMFRELNSERGSSQGSRGSSDRTERKDQAHPQRAAAEELERELAARRAARVEATRTESQQGAHMASELNFRGLFGTPPTDSSRSDFSLREVIGSQEQQSKNQQAVRDEFKAFLNSRQPGHFADPVNSWRNDFTRQPLNPAIGKPAEARSDIFATPAFGPQRAAPFVGAPVGLGDNSVGRVIPGLPTTPFPSAAPPLDRGFQPQQNRAFGMNSLGGHNR